MERGPSTNRLDFGGDPDQDQDSEFFYCPVPLISLSVEDICSLVLL